MKPKKSSKLAPRFFCEQCNTEVGRGVTECPVCGNHFGAVRCPACGTTATAEQFKNGCPNCNYGAHADAAPPHTQENSKPPPHIVPTIPLWLYALTVIVGVMFITVLLVIQA